MNFKKILKSLQKMGFRVEANDGTRRKLYPPQDNLPFYSLHLSHGDDRGAYYGLKSFAKKNWNLDLDRI